MSPPISSVGRSPLGVAYRSTLGALGAGSAPPVQCLTGTAGYTSDTLLSWTPYGYDTAVGGATDAERVGGGPPPTPTDPAPLGWRRLTFTADAPEILPDWDTLRNWWFSGLQSGVQFSPTENGNPTFKYQEWSGSAPGPYAIYTEDGEPPIQQIGTIDMFENFYRMRSASSNRNQLEVYGNVGYTGAEDPIDLGFFEGEAIDICNVPPGTPNGYDLIRVDPIGGYVCPDTIFSGVGARRAEDAATGDLLFLADFDPIPRWPDVLSAVSVTVQAPNNGTTFGPIPISNLGLGPDGRPCYADFGTFKAYAWPFESGVGVNREMRFSLAQDSPGLQISAGTWQFTFNFA